MEPFGIVSLKMICITEIRPHNGEILLISFNNAICCCTKIWRHCTNFEKVYMVWTVILLFSNIWNHKEWKTRKLELKLNRNGIVTVIMATLIVACKLDHLYQIKLILFHKVSPLYLRVPLPHSLLLLLLSFFSMM